MNKEQLKAYLVKIDSELFNITSEWDFLEADGDYFLSEELMDILPVIKEAMEEAEKELEALGGVHARNCTC